MGETNLPLRPLVWLALLWTLFGIAGCAPEPSPSPSPSPDVAPKPETTAETDVAVVGGRPISRDELTAKLYSSFGAQTLREMMVRKAVRLEADALGLRVTEAELGRELRSLSEGYESESQYYGEMKAQFGMSKEDVKEDATDRLLTEKIAIRGVVVTGDEIERYRKEHAKEFGPRKQYRLAQIVTGSEKTADDVLDQLAGGADFAALAARYSSDALTASSGGDLGWVDEDDPIIDPALLEAAKGLNIGEATGPIGIGSGYVVLKLDGTNKIEAKDQATVKEEIRNALALEKAVPIQELERSLLKKYGAKVLDTDLRP